MAVTRRLRLPGGEIEYALRPMARSRGLRVTMDARRGVVVTVPLPTRRGWARPEPIVEAFLKEREPWLRRHLERQRLVREELEARGGLVDGALVRYRGELHRLKSEGGLRCGLARREQRGVDLVVNQPLDDRHRRVEPAAHVEGQGDRGSGAGPV